MDQLTEWLNAHAKAVVSALGTAVVMFFAFRTNGMTADEWETLIMSALGAGGFTWAVPNIPPMKMITADFVPSPAYTSVTTTHKDVSISATPAPEPNAVVQDMSLADPATSTSEPMKPASMGFAA
jgi:hypothetical protein